MAAAAGGGGPPMAPRPWWQELRYVRDLGPDATTDEHELIDAMASARDSGVPVLQGKPPSVILPVDANVAARSRAVLGARLVDARIDDLCMKQRRILALTRIQRTRRAIVLDLAKHAFHKAVTSVATEEQLFKMKDFAQRRETLHHLFDDNGDLEVGIATAADMNELIEWGQREMGDDFISAYNDETARMDGVMRSRRVV